jgi:hypothetical protein
VLEILLLEYIFLVASQYALTVVFINDDESGFLLTSGENDASNLFSMTDRVLKKGKNLLKSG